MPGRLRNRADRSGLHLSDAKSGGRREDSPAAVYFWLFMENCGERVAQEMIALSTVRNRERTWL
jgi:hypothetical protein